ncbi:MAG: hypothetical protein HY526_09075 [Betaproteobacteria bacterium]|nr:hypothetical protein [Betaproteobacteria bacterium]
MTRHTVLLASGLALMWTLAIGVPATLAAESGEPALTTQTKQMDSLVTTRGETTVTGKISSDFSAFAGSSTNADALVTGLRGGTAITLTSTDAKGVTTATTFTPPTGKMGYGNVYTSLALAKQQLAGLGITEPTPQQLQAALVGGTVTTPSGQTTSMTGVLELRAQGMGWGQIAQSYGYKLGPVISGMKSANARITSATTATGTTTTKSGIVTGAGGSGQGHAYGRGIVTGAGTGVGSAGAGQGNAYGRGVVSGTGSAAGQANPGQGKAPGKGN